MPDHRCCEAAGARVDVVLRVYLAYFEDTGARFTPRQCREPAQVFATKSCGIWRADSRCIRRAYGVHINSPENRPGMWGYIRFMQCGVKHSFEAKIAYIIQCVEPDAFSTQIIYVCRGIG